MANLKKFQDNLYARVRVRPLVYYCLLEKYLDEVWIIEAITKEWFRICNPINGYIVEIGFDSLREWASDFKARDGLRHGIVVLKAQITLQDNKYDVEPLTDRLLTESLKRRASQR